MPEPLDVIAFTPNRDLLAQIGRAADNAYRSNYDIASGTTAEDRPAAEARRETAKATIESAYAEIRLRQVIALESIADSLAALLGRLP